MPKRSSKDLNETAFSVMQQATGQAKPEPKPEKNPAAVALGRLGGLKGGKARAASMTAKQRSKVAKLAAQLGEKRIHKLFSRPLQLVTKPPKKRNNRQLTTSDL